MLPRGMYAIAVLLLGVGLGGAQTTDLPLAVGKPLVLPAPVQTPPRETTPAIKPVVYTPDVPPPATPATPATPALGQGSLLSVEAVGPASIQADQPLAYVIIVRNAGSYTLGRVHVEDVLPPGAKLRSSEPAAEVQNERMTWTLGNLEPGGERRIKVEIQPGPGAEVVMAPTATFTLAKPCRTRIAPPPLVLTQTAPPTAPRGVVTFQIHVANSSDQAINNIVLHDTLPVGLVSPKDYELLHSKSGVAGTSDLPAPSPDQPQPVREHYRDGFNLGPGETKTVNFTTYAVQSGRLTNHLEATAAGGLKAVADATVLITDPPEVSANQTLFVEGSAYLSLEVVHQEAAIDLGAESVYEVRVLNLGTADATNVQFIATLPEGLLGVSAEGPTPGHVQPKQIVFDPLPQMPGRSKILYCLHVKGQTAGNWDWSVQTTAAQLTQPCVQQVITRVVTK
jgi:uncharacterized repeat protein (TIGR01451 family)